MKRTVKIEIRLDDLIAAVAGLESGKKVRNCSLSFYGGETCKNIDVHNDDDVIVLAYEEGEAE